MSDRLLQTIRADLWQSAISAILAIVLVQAVISEARDGVSVALLLLGPSAIAIAMRVRYPEAALALQLLVTLTIAIVADDAMVLHWGFATASLLSLSSIRERPTVIISGACVLVVLHATATINNPDGWRDGLSPVSNLGLLAWTIASAGVGTAVRLQRQYIHSVEDQAARAEQNREVEAQRRVAEERLRIARDLHDAVAHQMAVVSMFTGLARTTLTTAPDQAEQALAHAQTATRSVLSELQQILRILREPGADESGDVPGMLEQPVPGIDDIDNLIRSFEEIGMAVERVETGKRRPLASAADLAAYRVVQEALTNAHKHGDGSAQVRLDFNREMLVIDITNPTSRADRHGAETAISSGFGLIGMRERVRMLGGTLVHGDDGQTFHLTAELPLGDRDRRTPDAETSMSEGE